VPELQEWHLEENGIVIKRKAKDDKGANPPAPIKAAKVALAITSTVAVLMPAMITEVPREFQLSTCLVIHPYQMLPLESPDQCRERQHLC